MSILPENYNNFQIYNHKNKCLARIIKSFEISIDRFYFDTESIIRVPRLINLHIDLLSSKKLCTSHRDFNSNLYVTLSNYDFPSDAKFIFPSYSASKFVCLACNRIHGKNSNKCCSLENSVIKIADAEIKDLYLVSQTKINDFLSTSRKNFISLHFPDLLDTIMIR